ncbi:MAG: DNA repair protein RecO [Eubacterium sp.]|nr:DNA repair protein RecO [Eubacterium sp.]
MKQKVTGIVLLSAAIGEYDKRVVLLTKEEGRITAFARGARRPKNHLSAVTEPMCFGSFFVYAGRDSYSVDDATIDNYFPKLKNDLEKLYTGMYFLEVADYFTREGMRAPKELELVYRSLLALEKEAIPDELVRRVFELRMMAISGYAPHYDADKGAYLDDMGVWKLSEAATYTVGQILNLPLNKLYSFTVSERVLAELEKTVGTFLQRNSDKQFNTLKTLKQLTEK